MQVQDIINSVSNDMRQVLSNTSPDTAILIPWVDRIHKDVLHTSLFKVFNEYMTTINTTVNVSSYTFSLSGPAIRRITSVYDRTFDRVLLPYESLGLPSVKADAESGQPEGIPRPMLTASTMEQWPEYYKRLEASNQILLFPAPQKVAFQATNEIYYEGQVATLVNLTDTLVVPNDGEDLVVAGVNSLAAAYLKNPEDTATWKATYEAMKAGAFNG
jgi:hypothetical protein